MTSHHTPRTDAPRQGSRRRVAAVVAGCAAALGLAVVTGTAGGTTWAASATLSANGTAGSPHVVNDAAGTSTAAWYWDDPAVPGTSYVIQTARTLGGTWGAAETISAGGSVSPYLAVDASGTVTAVWQRDTTNGSGPWAVESARYVPGAGWGSVETVATGFAGAVSTLRVAADPDGPLMATWSRNNSGTEIVEAARYSSGWGTPTNLAAADFQSTQPAVAAAGSGTFVVVWLRWPAFAQAKRVAARVYSGSWGTTQDISDPQNTQGAQQVSANASGVIAATWERSNGSNMIVQARFSTAGSWGAISDLSASGRNAASPQIAVDPDGGATATWARSNGTNDIVQAARFSSTSSTWGTPADLSATGQNAASPQVAVDPAGEATVVWSRSNGSNTIIQAASTAQGIWGSASSLSATGANASAPRVAAGGNGGSTSVWARTPGFTYVQSSIGVNTPGAPTSVQAQPSAGGATVSWAAPVITGGADVASYTATADPGGANCVATAPATTCPIVGLDNGTAYTFTVRATNSSGTGPASTASAPMTPIAPPGAPTQVSATASDGSVTAEWLAPVDNGGSTIISYIATASPGGATCTATAPTTTCVISGLMNGTGYTVIVAAVNAAGTGSASAPSASVMPSAPNPPSPSPSGRAAEAPNGGPPPARAQMAGRAWASPQPSSVTLTSNVRVNGAGSLHQEGIRARGASTTARGRGRTHSRGAVLCQATRLVPRAGTYRMTCILDSAVKAELRRRAIRVNLVTTFTSSGGSTITTAQTVLVRRTRAPRARVTG